MVGQERTGGKPAVLNMLRTFVGCRRPKGDRASIPGAPQSYDDMVHHQTHCDVQTHWRVRSCRCKRIFNMEEFSLVST